MKLLRFAITIPVILGLVAAFAACSDDDGGGISGSGNIVTRDFDLTGFTSVRLDLFEAEITQSETYSVTVRADDNVIDEIDVETDGDTLVLRASSGARFKGNVTLEATITMPTIESLELNGAASADLDGFDSLDTLELDLSGASSVTGEFVADDVDILASGASRVKLAGIITGVTVDASGASRIDLKALFAESGEIELSGASDATVNVRDSLGPVDVSGASTLIYLGHPTLGDVSTSGASSVDQID